MSLEYLKRRFRVERLGDLTINWITVLVYLDSTKRGKREPSAKTLEGKIGVPENTITNYAFPALVRYGYVRILGENLPRRDANSYEVTPKGKRALGNFLNAVGFFELGMMVVISLVVGALLSIMYLAILQSPLGFPLFLSAALFGIAVEGFFLWFFVRMARQRRREILSIMLKESEQSQQQS